jgi:hypothetical protein
MKTAHRILMEKSPGNRPLRRKEENGRILKWIMEIRFDEDGLK